MLKIKYIYFVLTCFLVVSLQACDANKTKQTATTPAEVPKQLKSFSEAYFYEIIPLADGGAYALSGRSIWYLRGAEAIKVKEASQIGKQDISQLKTNKEKVLWAMLQHERAKRKNAEEKIEEVENNDDRYADQEDQFLR